MSRDFQHTSEHFPLCYRGELVADGSMDLEQLAPSLRGLSLLFKRVGVLWLPGGAQVKVAMQSSTRRGSLIADLALFVASPPLLANIPNSASWFLDQAKTLLRSIAKAFRPGSRVAVTGDNNILIVGHDGSEMRVDGVISRGFLDRSVNKHVSQLLHPIRQNRMEELQIGEVSLDSAVLISAEDARRITGKPPVQAATTITTREAEIAPLSVWLDGEFHSFRFRERDHVFNARVADRQFLGQLASGELTASGGMVLRVRLREEESRIPGEPMPVYVRTVEEVLSISHPESGQGRLGFGEAPSSPPE